MGLNRMRHYAWSLGSQVAVITDNAQSEAAQLAKMVIAPELGRMWLPGI